MSRNSPVFQPENWLISREGVKIEAMERGNHAFTGTARLEPDIALPSPTSDTGRENSSCWDRIGVSAGVPVLPLVHSSHPRLKPDRDCPTATRVCVIDRVGRSSPELEGESVMNVASETARPFARADRAADSCSERDYFSATASPPLRVPSGRQTVARSTPLLTNRTPPSANRTFTPFVW